MSKPASLVAPPLPSRELLPTLSPQALVRLALAVVYVVWGSTYLVLRVVVVSMPPLLSGGVRFAIAGGILFAVVVWRGAPLPSRRQWVAALPVGVLLCLVANGLTSVAEREVSSGFAAVVCATVPLWITGIGLLAGDRPGGRATAGLVLGLMGVGLMVGPELAGVSGSAWLVLVSPIGWALGSHAMRRADLPKGAMAAAMQMLVGGAVNLSVGGALGERFTAMPGALAVLGLAYLIVFGSIVAFTAYAFLLRTTTPAVATSYAYVNPVIAVGLGVVALGEPLRPWTVIGGVIVVCSVALVVRGSRSGREVLAGAPCYERAHGHPVCLSPQQQGPAPALAPSDAPAVHLHHASRGRDRGQRRVHRRDDQDEWSAPRLPRLGAPQHGRAAAADARRVRGDLARAPGLAAGVVGGEG